MLFAKDVDVEIVKHVWRECVNVKEVKELLVAYSAPSSTEPLFGFKII